MPINVDDLEEVKHALAVQEDESDDESVVMAFAKIDMDAIEEGADDHDGVVEATRNNEIVKNAEDIVRAQRM